MNYLKFLLSVSDCCLWSSSCSPYFFCLMESLTCGTDYMQPLWGCANDRP